MKKLLLPLIMMAGMAHGQSADMQNYVREAQGQVGAEIGPGAKVAALNLDAERFDFILQFDAARGADTSAGSLETFGTFMSQGLCVQPPVKNYVASGGEARVVIVNPAGQVLHATSVSSC